MDKRVKILLVDDHELTRNGIAYGLKFYNDVEVVGKVEDGQKSLEFVKQNKVDVILMDIAMPIMNGITATKKIHELFPDIKIVMLTSVTDKNSVLSAFNSGANAYCMKDVNSDELIKIIKTVMNGAVWIAPSVAAYIMDFLKTQNSSNVDFEHSNNFNLTAREKEILKLLAEGFSNKEIAEEYVLSLHTVKNHVKNIIQKLAVSDRTQAAILAVKENLVQ